MTPKATATFIAEPCETGVAHYRMKLPAEALGAKQFMLDRSGIYRRNDEGWQESDVIVYSTPRYPHQVEGLASLKAAGRKIILDVDDWTPSLPESHGLHGQEATEMHQCLLAALPLADALTTTTQWIADRLEETFRVLFEKPAPPIHIIPSGIDLERWDDVAATSFFPDRVVIGMFGAMGHGEAIDAWMPALERIGRERDDVRFLAVGIDLTSRFSRRITGKNRCVSIEFKGMQDYPAYQKNCDIIIAPSLHTDFYRSKSDLRVMEAWAAGACVIAGHETYWDTVAAAQGGAALPYGQVDEWRLVKAIRALCEDGTKRDKLARWGRQYLEANRTPERLAPLWQAAINSAMGACCERDDDCDGNCDRHPAGRQSG